MLSRVVLPVLGGSDSANSDSARYPSMRMRHAPRPASFFVVKSQSTLEKPNVKCRKVQKLNVECDKCNECQMSKVAKVTVMNVSAHEKWRKLEVEVTAFDGRLRHLA